MSEYGSKGWEDRYRPKAENSFSNFSEKENSGKFFSLTFRLFSSSWANKIFWFDSIEGMPDIDKEKEIGSW